MPWNEPGKDKDPWGQKNADGPPDLDEVFKDLKKKLNGLLGSGKGGSGGGDSTSSGRGPEDFSGLITLGILAAVVAWLLSGIYIVDEGKRGVETRFGAKTTVTMPGPHWHIPWPIENVAIIDVEEVRTASHSSQMLTQDENIVSLSLNVQYNVKSAEDYLFQVRDPDLTLKQALEAAIRLVVGRSNMDYVLTQGRSEVASQTKTILQEILDSYQTGLHVLQVNLNKAQPPEEVQDAFNDAIKAREDKERIINEANAYRNDIVPKARGEAASMLEQAEAYRTRVVKSAQGETERFVKLLTVYQGAPEVTRERLYIDTLEEIMASNPKVVIDAGSSGNLLYLPLDKILSGSGVSLPPLNSRPANNSAGNISRGPAIDAFRRNTSRSRVRETRQ